MEWYIGVLKKYAAFDGRARRKEYWMFILFNILVIFVLGGILFGLIMANYTGLGNAIVGLALTFYSFGTFLPAIGVTIRRLHDSGKSGWWIFINFVPAIGGLWFLYLMVIDGTPGDNQYGPSPKAGEVTA